MKKEDQPRLGTARNSKGFFYKYYPVEGDKTKRIAVPGGRCYKCSRITDAFCDKCQKWVCEEHLAKGEDEYICFCLECGKEQPAQKKSFK